MLGLWGPLIPQLNQDTKAGHPSVLSMLETRGPFADQNNVLAVVQGSTCKYIYVFTVYNSTPCTYVRTDYTVVGSLEV